MCKTSEYALIMSVPDVDYDKYPHDLSVFITSKSLHHNISHSFSPAQTFYSKEVLEKDRNSRLSSSDLYTGSEKVDLKILE